MFEYIKGFVAGIGADYVVIESGQMGYRVYTSRATINELTGKEGIVKLFTSLLVREDELKLCGFSEPLELELFHLLIGVSGVGPKMALTVLSSFEYHDLLMMIGSEMDTQLTKAPGVGKKTAQRIVLELKDKVGKLYGAENLAAIRPAAYTGASGLRHDIHEALMGLGFNQREIGTFLADQDLGQLTVEEAIKLALRNAGGRS